jgi:tetratricopeptide (TPR) repeat protein
MRALACSLLFAAACAAQRTPAWDDPPQPFGTVSDEIIARLIADGDRAFAARDEPTRIDEALTAWRAALRYRPGTSVLLVKMSRGARLRAQNGGAMALAEQSVSWAERALAASSPSLRAAASARGKSPRSVFGLAERPEQPALVAYVEALYAWADRAGTATVLEQRERIIAAAGRAVEIDRSAGFGAPDRVLGILYAELAPDVGGDLRRSEEHFEAALASAPGFLPTLVDYAEHFAVRRRDPTRYAELLRQVIDADPNALPDAAPENRLAQRAARRLLPADAR